MVTELVECTLNDDFFTRKTSERSRACLKSPKEKKTQLCIWIYSENKMPLAGKRCTKMGSLTLAYALCVA